MIHIVTNNPDVQRDAEIPHDVIFVDGTPIDVLTKTEELLQANKKLVSAPLPPNVPIMRGPYRSLVVENSQSQYDAAGILAVEKAKERYFMERSGRRCPGPSPDFGAIDRTMLLRALRDYSVLKKA